MKETYKKFMSSIKKDIECDKRNYHMLKENTTLLRKDIQKDKAILRELKNKK